MVFFSLLCNLFNSKKRKKCLKLKAKLKALSLTNLA